MFTESELNGKKLPELKEIGTTLKVDKAKTLRKPELIAGILKTFETAQAEEKTDPAPSPTAPAAERCQVKRKFQERKAIDLGKLLENGLK